MTLQDKNIIITGGGTGIGKALALKASTLGANVIICGRRQDKLIEATVHAGEHKDKIFPYIVNLTDSKSIYNFIDEIITRFKKIDILINNAGIISRSRFIDIQEEDWIRIIDTNLKAPFLLSQKTLLLNPNTDSNKIIINVSSILGKNGIKELAAYCASKFGLIGLTESLADEFKEKHVKVFAVCPGATYTDLHISDAGATIARHAMSPDFVARKIIDLIIEHEKHISGESIIIDRPVEDKVNASTITSKKLKIARFILKPIEPFLQRIYKFK